MTPQAFIAKWRDNPLSERAGAQPHFEDLCDLLGVEKPRDPESYQYERGAARTGAGRGWADVWKRNCFAWEYKAPGKDLGAALKQLMTYALALDNPPLLVVSDRSRIEIHTHFTGRPSEVHSITLEEIGQPQHLQKLRWLFEAPENFKPKLTTYAVTEAAAERMGTLARRLTERNVDPQQVAHFLIQCVFCMFAEDARLLPRKLFETVLDKSNPDGAKAQSRLTALFEAMRDGGDFALEAVPWFNGGLFKQIAVPALTTVDVVQLLDAARMDWGAIEPAILGTLFERGLNPDMRSQLGAHYTDPATILKLVRPVVEEPLLAEWQIEKTRIAALLEKAHQGGKGSKTARDDAQAAFIGFIQHLKNYRVLDPACGSGNFLYLALKALKDLEHRVNLEAEALGLHRELHIETSPANVLGIELNPYAAELARVTVWIGEIQWMLMHGYALKRDPILAPLDHIECRDAVLNFSLSPASGRYCAQPPLPQAGEGRGEGDSQDEKVYSPRFPASLPPEKLAFARELRRNQTNAETLMWRMLRNRNLKNAKFRRQHSVGKYILDFYCAECSLAIELDGGQHAEQHTYDTQRDAWLSKQGIRIVRFWNNQVLTETEAVLETIWAALPEVHEQAPSPPAPLPHAGEGSESEWPAVDAIVGNPPFLGGSKKRGELGDEYFKALNSIYKDRVPGGADLVTYWFEKARAQIEAGKAQRAGLVATNSIRGGANRKVLERILRTAPIFEAWSDEAWINNGAAVRVSLVCFGVHPSPASGRGVGGEGAVLDGYPVCEIHADLTAGNETKGALDLTLAKPLAENMGVSFMGASKKAPFDIAGQSARQILKLPNPNGRPNTDVIRPLWNGLDLTRRPRDVWIIDFGTSMSEADAALYDAPFQYVSEHVKPEREKNNREAYRKFWWRHAEARPGMRAALSGLTRFFATPHVAKHRLFTWLDVATLPDQMLIVIARSDDTTFGILHSRFHELWSLGLCTWLGKGNDPRYTPTTTFETFPFPAGLTPRDTAVTASNAKQSSADTGLPRASGPRNDEAEAIAAAAKKLNELREAWLNPPEWVDWVRTAEEEQAGFPLRPVAKPGHEAELKKRTLTNLYNQRPAWLDNAHKDLDAAVAAAYGWADYAPAMPDEEILRRLLALNLERAETEFQLEIGREVMRKHRAVLKVLADN